MPSRWSIWNGNKGSGKADISAQNHKVTDTWIICSAGGVFRRFLHPTFITPPLGPQHVITISSRVNHANLCAYLVPCGLHVQYVRSGAVAVGCRLPARSRRLGPPSTIRIRPGSSSWRSDPRATGRPENSRTRALARLRVFLMSTKEAPTDGRRATERSHHGGRRAVGESLFLGAASVLQARNR